MTSRFTSDVWYHFEKNAAGKNAKCRYCKNIFSITGGSTGNLSRHLNRKHPTISIKRSDGHQKMNRSRSPTTSSAAEEDLDAEVQSISDSGTAPSSSNTQEESRSTFIPPVHHTLSPLTQSGSGSRCSTPESQTLLVQPLLNKFISIVKPIPISQSRVIDKQLLKMICKHFQPFTIVEDVEFKQFIKMLNPGYSMPSRKTLSVSLLTNVYEETCDKIKIELAGVAVALTTDGWTSTNNTSFYSLTAHYLDLDNKGIMKCRLLECSEFPPERHTGENIAEWIDSKSKKWGLKGKICSITTDNASNMVSAIRQLNIKHIPCYAHSLNLVVQSAIGSSIMDIVEKVKKIVQYFKQSTHASAKLVEMQNNMGKPQLKLKQDVITRWNSTYDMLDRIFKNKEPLLSTMAILSLSDIPNLIGRDWKIIESVLPVLSIFYDVTNEISSEKNISLSKTSILTRLMKDHTEKYEQDLTIPEETRKLCNSLLRELHQRYDSLEDKDIVRQTILLDPRFKKRGFNKEGKYNLTREEVVNKIQAIIKANMGKPTDSTEPLPLAAPTTKPKTSSLNAMWKAFDEKTIKKSTISDPKALALIEVDKYLSASEPLLDRNSDPFKWWKDRKTLYPNLYFLAKCRLCIPATSVPSERVFSKAGELVSEKRSRLTGKKIQQILFLNSNME